MNRIFHVRIGAGHWLTTGLLAACFIYAFWNSIVWPLVPNALLLLVQVERMVHTTYTLTPQGTLVIDRGRFLRRRTILLKEITRVERSVVTLPMTRVRLTSRVLLYNTAGRCERLLPLKEEEFVRTLTQRIESSNHP